MHTCDDITHRIDTASHAATHALHVCVTMVVLPACSDLRNNDLMLLKVQYDGRHALCGIELDALRAQLTIVLASCTRAIAYTTTHPYAAMLIQ